MESRTSPVVAGALSFGLALLFVGLVVAMTSTEEQRILRAIAVAVIGGGVVAASIFTYFKDRVRRRCLTGNQRRSDA